MGVALRQAGYRRGWFEVRHLARPVVSVGNLTMGGTGKTPLVAAIAGILLRRGWKPSILTRGYGRAGKQTMVVVPPGAGRAADPREVGDEPALLARLVPEVPVVVSADRFRAGQAAEEQFAVDVHLLDDGFQHLKLARAVDVLALDVTQTISDRHLFPAGRQREPLDALRRAHLVVLTRADSADPQPLADLVAEQHPAARIFTSRTKLLGWADAFTGEAVSTDDLRSRKVVAFCGLGNSSVFFVDLRRWGFELAGQRAFPDHHVYTGGEIQELAAEAGRRGAAALLTTQKDAVKLSAAWQPQLPVLACAIEADILERGEFERALWGYLEGAR
jgi:tetraacyldisaccharide 4'-kinase